MDIGTLDRRISIEHKSVARDPDMGSEIATWSELGRAWAKIVDALDIKLAGAEKVEASERILIRPTRVRIRYRADVTTAMRIKLLDRDDRILQIVSIAEVGRRDAIDLQCEAYSV